MIVYTCDLCEEKCNGKEFALPIAATWINGEPCDLIPIKMNLCRNCRSKIYKTIESLTKKHIIELYNKQALDIKRSRTGVKYEQRNN